MASISLKLVTVKVFKDGYDAVREKVNFQKERYD